MKPRCACCNLPPQDCYRDRFKQQIEDFKRETQMLHPSFSGSPIADDEAIKKSIRAAAIRRWRGRVLLVLAGFVAGFALAAAVLR